MPARACAGALASARPALQSPVATTPPVAVARSGLLAPDLAQGAAPDPAPALATPVDPLAAVVAASGAADAPVPPSASGGVPQAREGVKQCMRHSVLRIPQNAALRPLHVWSLQRQRRAGRPAICCKQGSECGRWRAGARPAWELSTDVAALVEQLRGAAARSTPKEGTRQLPKPVLQLLLPLACALRREVSRKKPVVSENEARPPCAHSCARVFTRRYFQSLRKTSFLEPNRKVSLLLRRDLSCTFMACWVVFYEGRLVCVALEHWKWVR